jgi:F0F1-type ATP synthase epsilon subunit
MLLNVITLKGIEFEGEVSSVNLKTTSGEITVLDGHRPLITQLMEGQAIVVKENGDKLKIKIGSGFLEFGANNQATILAG